MLRYNRERDYAYGLFLFLNFVWCVIAALFVLYIFFFLPNDNDVVCVVCVCVMAESRVRR